MTVRAEVLVYQLAAQLPVYRAKLDAASPDWNQVG